jgi:methionine aminotransferase
MIRSKLPNVGTSIFAVMTKMAAENNAINLSQGFPDFAVSEELIDLVHENMKAQKNQYAPMPGILDLRLKISEKTQTLYGCKCNPETEITVTAGGTQALFTAITAFVNEGDEVLVFEPAYDSYVPAIRLNGGVPVFVQTRPPNYTIDWEEVNKLITARTTMIIINSPQNPAGFVFLEEDMKMLQKLVSGTKIMILSDEVYEHIVFDGKEHFSVLRFPQLAEKSIVVSSFGKTFHATGWKIGYCVASEAITKEFRKIHQFNVFAVNTPIQYALAKYLENPEKYLTLSTFYQAKRDKFLEYLKDSELEIIPASGTYFQSVNFSEIFEGKDTELAEILTKQYLISGIPMSAFYHDAQKHCILRFCFAKSDETLKNAADRIIQFCRDRKKNGGGKKKL